MIEHRFYLNDFEIDEPMGFADIVMGVTRDNDWQGVYFQATINDLTFYGAAADYLQEQKAFYGLKANVTFRAEEKCDPLGDFEPVLIGRLNFARYRSECGLNCTVSMPVEQEGCAMLVRNRYDQAVDVDSTVAFDRITNLPDYSGIGFEMELAAQDLDVGVVGAVAEDGWRFFQEDIPAGQGVVVRPVFTAKEKESINRSQLEPEAEYGTQGTFDYPISPILLLDDDPRCFTGVFDIEIRLKGTYDIEMSAGGSSITGISVVIFETDDPMNTSPNQLEFARQTLPSGGIKKTGAFDLSFSNSAVTLRQGLGFYGAIGFTYITVGARPTIEVIWDPLTHVSITAVRSCPPTNAQVYLVNETLSRLTEAITNNCIKVKSDYFGRVDSQPYASPDDGCGALEVLTNGLKLRNAETNKMFLSLQEAFEGLRGIHNIGMGFEPNPSLTGNEWLRIEPIEYFYQDVEVLRFPFVPRVQNEVDESKHYSVIKIGYNKWEPKAIGGLDEYNSTREFRTSLETVRNTLDATSNFIAAGTVIEVTRQQSFVETGEADTTYDNDTFIICVTRLAYDFIVEQGLIGSPANIFSPSTAYNFRITPLRNLMRWFKSTINSYANIIDSAAKLFFSSGTGNYTAAGEFLDTDCRLENGPKAENIDLATTDFLNAVDYLPLVKPENITFTYPFTRADWEMLKAQPYGKIAVQCGNGGWLYGYVTEINWRVKQGDAELKLRLKW